MSISPALEMGIADALHRIKNNFQQTEGQTYLSFSGGRDSTVVAELIKMAGLPEDIPFVFANTGIELDATLRFVKEYDYPNIVMVKPRKPAPLIWKEDGKPILSKTKSDWLDTAHRSDNLLDSARGRQLISGEAEKAGEKLGRRTKNALAFKHFHLLHPDLEYKVANKCCHYMKKMPFKDFVSQNGMKGTLTGVKVAEGGARAMAYKSCTHVDKKGYITTMPIFDWSEEMLDEFIEAFNVKLSDCYEVYGMDRTGCMACPFSKYIQRDLQILHEHEPKKYRASMKMLGDVYMDSDVECPWDEAYMEKLRERRIVNENRRNQMLGTFKTVTANRVNIK